LVLIVFQFTQIGVALAESELKQSDDLFDVLDLTLD
jgi:hypothetical protein